MQGPSRQLSATPQLPPVIVASQPRIRERSSEIVGSLQSVSPVWSRSMQWLLAFSQLYFPSGVFCQTSVESGSKHPCSV